MIFVSNWSPIAFSVGNFNIYWYGVLHALGLALMLVIGSYNIRNSNQWNAKKLTDLFTYGVIGVLIGGRFGYVFFYEIALKTGINNIAKISREFGLGLPTGLNLPGEKGGLIPDRDWKLREKKTIWRPGETIIAGIGQGYVLVTPMQLALMTARIANGGIKVMPTLLKSDGKLVNNFRKASISKDNLNIIKKAMEKVSLDDFGTGRTFRLGNKGVEMAGKTGTVQVRRISTIERESEEGVIKNEDRIWEWRDHALYVGYAPMEKPKYAISVIVEHGGSGSSKAGPIARDIMEATLQDDPTKFIPKNPIQKPII